MSDQQLMPEDLAKEFRYAEQWEVYVSNQREPYLMNEFEYAVFQDAVNKGIKGVISFDWGMINTSFFVSSYRKSRKLKEEFMPKMIEEPQYREPTPEERARTQKIINEARERLKVKFSPQK